MAKIAFLLPTEEMIKQAHSIIKNEKTEVTMKVVTSENVLDEANSAVKNGAVVLIARGNHASLIRQKTDIPLVEIILTGQEIAKLIYQAKKVLNKQNPLIGLIGFRNMFGEVKSFEEILGVRINEYPVKYSDEIEATVKKACEDKVDMIIGGEIAIGLAEKLKIPNMFLKSGEDSLSEAFRIAEKVAYAIDLEKKNTAEFKTILDYSFSAIIKLDSSGNIIILNYLAEKILSKHVEDLIGKHISKVFDLFDDSLIESVLTKGKRLYSILLQKDKLSLVANIAPITVDEKVEGAIISFQEFKKIQEMEAEIRKEVYKRGYIAKNNFSQIIGDSEYMNETKLLAKTYSKYDSPIIITGEYGIGKELFAKCIHNESLRRNSPFVTVDCASMPHEILEKKLYGYVDTNYTHMPVRKGLFEIAHTGTIYFDKITEMSIYDQLSLLRVIKENSIVRLDEDRALPIDVRIICSVDKDILSLMKEGKFSEELYYELNVLALNILPLRDRKKDIEVLLGYYIDKYSNEYMKYVYLNDAAKEIILSYPWPGNAQQLIKFCQKVIVLSTKKVLDEEFISDCLKDYLPFINRKQINVDAQTERPVVVYRNQEASRILELLNKYNGNRGKVAGELNISKTTLWRKIKKYNIENEFNL